MKSEGFNDRRGLIMNSEVFNNQTELIVNCNTAGVSVNSFNPRIKRVHRDTCGVAIHN